jgi:hypothetical protein
MRRANTGPTPRFDPIETQDRKRLRVPPPKSLNKDEVAEWFRIVNTAPADWFSDSNTGSLEQYCRHVVQARRVAKMIEAHTAKPEYNQVTYFNLLSRQLGESKMIVRLMTAMRLTHQSSMEAPNIKKRMPVEPPMDPLMSDDDDDNDDAIADAA